MRSKILQKILDETPREVEIFVDKYQISIRRTAASPYPAPRPEIYCIQTTVCMKYFKKII